MRRASPRPLGAALGRVADSVMPATLLAEVQRAWPEVAGEAFARAGQPVAERDGVVTVACSSSVWAQEVDLLSERIVAALNEALGRDAVRRLRVVATSPR